MPLSDPFEQAMLDYFQGEESAEIVVKYSNGDEHQIPMAYFFRDSAEMPPQEELALSLCRGRILDIGAGSGCHSLILQQQGSVIALDHSPIAVKIMQARGVKQVVQADIWTWQSDPFDTLLLLMNGIGLVKTLDGLSDFLKLAQQWVMPSGQILLDSADIRLEEEEEEEEEDPKIGELSYVVEYGEQIGSPVPWLYVDPETLMARALAAGWFGQVIFQDEEGGYLARLTLLG